MRAHVPAHLRISSTTRVINVRRRSDDGGVGSNKRYPYLGGKLAEERELRAAAKAGTLQTLTSDQLRHDAHVVTIVPDRMKLWGLAWLRFGDVDVRCTVLVRRWTSGAVGVEVGVDGGDPSLLDLAGSLPAPRAERGRLVASAALPLASPVGDEGRSPRAPRLDQGQSYAVTRVRIYLFARVRFHVLPRSCREMTTTVTSLVVARAAPRAYSGSIGYWSSSS